MQNFHHLLKHLMMSTAEVELSVKMFAEMLSKGSLYPDKGMAIQAKSMLKSFSLV